MDSIGQRHCADRQSAQHPARGGQTPDGQARLRPAAKTWVVERSFAWAARFRRLARDYERLPETLAGLHFIAFACLLLSRLPLLLLGPLPVHNTL